MTDADRLLALARAARWTLPCSSGSSLRPAERESGWFLALAAMRQALPGAASPSRNEEAGHRR